MAILLYNIVILLTDVAIPSARKIIEKESQKKLKYKNQVQKFRECGT
jgi:hypothetical protein